MSSAHITGIASGALALAATAVLATAPTAAARSGEVAVSGGFGLGFLQYGTGCTYTVTAIGAPGADGITLTDAVDGYDTGGAFGPVEEVEPGVFAADWTPLVTGRHVLSAGMGASTAVNVVVGYDLGLVCAALPTPPSPPR
ncbi:hypothetical protein [Nocardia sp. X0981]